MERPSICELPPPLLRLLPLPLTLDVCDHDGYCSAGRRPPQPLAEVNHILEQLRPCAPLQDTHISGSISSSYGKEVERVCMGCEFLAP